MASPDSGAGSAGTRARHRSRERGADPERTAPEAAGAVAPAAGPGLTVTRSGRPIGASALDDIGVMAAHSTRLMLKSVLRRIPLAERDFVSGVPSGRSPGPDAVTLPAAPPPG